MRHTGTGATSLRSGPRKLHIVGGSPLNYPPPQRINHAVPGAEWPFTATTKGEGDVVISALAVTPTRRAETRSRLRSWVARLSSKTHRRQHHNDPHT